MMMHIKAENPGERGWGGREAKGLADDGVDPDYRDKRNLQ